MTLISRLISRYLIFAIIPYFAASWMLLSVILFIQQAGRFADIFFGVNIPTNLVWQLTIALIPNVIAFTCPTALLVGTVIGLAKMQGDSELVAIRAAGVGNFQIAFPIVLLGILMSGFAFIVNQQGVPAAAALVRKVGLQSAIQKLESPIEPGTFNSEVAGYTIYVRGGDLESGRWTNLFAYREDPSNGVVRLLTSKEGRVDTSDQNSELVLENASAVTLPLQPGTGKYVMEKIGDVRFAIKTRRAEMLEALAGTKVVPEELSLSALVAYADSHEGREAMDARILWQRRLLLSFSPLIFCILGTAMVLRFNRGGQGFGTVLALIGLVGYYSIGFLGEQLVRTNTIPVWAAAALPIGASFLAVLWLQLADKMKFASRVSEWMAGGFRRVRRMPNKLQMRNLFVDLTTGLRDFDLLRDLLRYYLLTLCFLLAIFVIFTAFELWKFAGAIPNGTALLGRYLFYFTPFIYLQVTAPAAMIATLATYVIKSRQNEIITWTSAGQSVYRLLAPCFALMLVIGGANWLAQEYIVPRANIIQDDARDRLQNKGEPKKEPSDVWIAQGNYILSFRRPGAPVDLPAALPGPAKSRGDLPQTLPFDTGRSEPPSNSISAASDNEIGVTSCSTCPTRVSVYEFGDNGQRLQTVYRAAYAEWNSGKIELKGNVEKDVVEHGSVSASNEQGIQLAIASNPFILLDGKPSHTDTAGAKMQRERATSEYQERSLGLAIEVNYTTIFMPLISALLVAPFSFSLSRKGKASAVATAVGIWLLFAGTGAVFEQIGLNGLLSPAVAIWGPLAIFAAVGVYLLTRVRT